MPVTEADYVIFDNARNNPTLPDNYEPDVELQRFSQDHIVNRNGRNLLQSMITTIISDRMTLFDVTLRGRVEIMHTIC